MDGELAVVDFRKLLTAEQREKLDRDRESLAKEKAEHAEMTAYELVVRALHDWHNSGCTGRKGMNGYGPADCVYDAALVFRVLPELIERLAELATRPSQCGGDRGGLGDKETQLWKEIRTHRRGETPHFKCPMKNCTGYVRLP
jgi:hypothetical protein